MMNKSLFEVTSTEAEQTLIAALRGWLDGKSWGEVRKLVRARRVLVNGALSLDEARKLTAGERVEIAAQPQAPPPTDEDVLVRHADPDLIVVEKPAGMTTLRHAAERRWPEARKLLQPTLDEGVVRLLARAEAPRHKHLARQKRPRVRAVQRLDRDTSGLLVFARSPAAEQGLIEQFSRHTVERVYHAVVVGHPVAQRIETRLVRDRGDGLRGSTPDPTAGKPAITHIRPLEPLGDYSLIECRLETGRTHQIRIHLSELGHPVCGDAKYGGDDRSQAPRLALHAAALGFVHPSTGERLHFEMSWPSDLQKFVARLRRGAG